jgi:hypothetical protein
VILLRLLVLALTALMAVITLAVAVVALLGIGWLAVAIPVLIVIGAIGAGRALWRRWAGRADTDRP